MNRDNDDKSLAGWLADNFGRQTNETARPSEGLERSEKQPLQEIHLQRVRLFEMLVDQVMTPLYQSREPQVRFHPEDGRREEAHERLFDRIENTVADIREHLRDTQWFGPGVYSEDTWDFARTIALHQPDILRIGIRQVEGDPDQFVWQVLEQKTVDKHIQPDRTAPDFDR